MDWSRCPSDYLRRIYRRRGARQARQVVRNFGYAHEARRLGPAQPALAEAAPRLLGQEPRDFALWPYLFAVFGKWTWGWQPTGDCTRWMQQHLFDTLLCTLYAAGKVRRPSAQVAGESLYGLAKCELVNSYRYHGAGATGWALAEAAAKFGMLYRERYEDGRWVCDLSEETGLSVAWGDRGNGLPDWLEPIAARHKASAKARVRTPEEAGLCIQSGRPVQFCGYTYWGVSRDSDGVARSLDAGWHAMTATGVRWVAKSSPPRVESLWICNSGHGPHCEGPVGPIAMPESYAACGSWVPRKYLADVYEAGDCFVQDFVGGWEPLELPDYGFDGKLLG